MARPKRVTRGPTATPIVLGDLKIHPAIGIARVGNDPRAFFLGPEVPGVGPVGADAGVGTPVSSGPFSGFKTSASAIKRQAQRFYVFFHQGIADAIEVNLDHPQVKAIEWSVHLANKKAAFFKFGGLRGSSGDVYSPATPRRNAGEPINQLVIDPGKPQTISGRRQGPKRIDFNMGGNWPKHQSTGAVVIPLLGELRTDSAGRLVVLGGRGASRPFKAGATITDFANSDGWLDDVSDGFVAAKVTMKNDQVFVAQSAWILVGPPDYAPGIGQVVTLYDTLWDVAATNSSIAIPPIQMFNVEPLKRLATFRNNRAAYKPEWFSDIEPLLQNTMKQRFVFGGISHSMPQTALNTKADSGVTAFLRPVAGNREFTVALGSMPLLFGDDFFTAGSNQQALSVTASQMENMTLWQGGTFDTGAVALDVTPQGLDRAALESCIGGAFVPGIETSWMIRHPSLYAEPFRLKPVGTVLNSAMAPPLTIAPGLFSQQMAIPWQADFLDCADGLIPSAPAGSRRFAWWPAQRPIDVIKAGAPVRWDRGLPAGPDALIAGWVSRGFVVQVGAGFEEQGGPP